MSISTPTHSRLSALLIATIFVASLGACSTSSGRDPETKEIVESGTTHVFSLQVGDCFDDEEDNEVVSDVPTVPCSEPHDNEIYHSFLLPEGEFPGDEAVDAAADETCFAKFESFVGTDYETSELDYFPLTPLEDSWNEFGDREIICALWDPAGKTSGSLEGAAR